MAKPKILATGWVVVNKNGKVADVDDDSVYAALVLKTKEEAEKGLRPSEKVIEVELRRKGK